MYPMKKDSFRVFLDWIYLQCRHKIAAQANNSS